MKIVFVRHSQFNRETGIPTAEGLIRLIRFIERHLLGRWVVAVYEPGLFRRTEIGARFIAETIAILAARPAPEVREHGGLALRKLDRFEELEGAARRFRERYLDPDTLPLETWKAFDEIFSVAGEEFSLALQQIAVSCQAEAGKNDVIVVIGHGKVGDMWFVDGTDAAYAPLGMGEAYEVDVSCDGQKVCLGSPRFLDKQAIG